MASPRTLHRDRRRQRRQDAEREILEAAERLLRQRRFRDVTVDDVMAATSQSRTAFYRFFADRQPATAFVWMFERYLAATFGRPEPGDRASAVETLFTIWLRTLYGSQPP